MKTLTLLLLLFPLLPVWAGEYNPVLDIKDPAPKWEELPATNGKRIAFDDFKAKQVLVVVYSLLVLLLVWR